MPAPYPTEFERRLRPRLRKPQAERKDARHPLPVFVSTVVRMVADR